MRGLLPIQVSQILSLTRLITEIEAIYAKQTFYYKSFIEYLEKQLGEGERELKQYLHKQSYFVKTSTTSKVLIDI